MAAHGPTTGAPSRVLSIPTTVSLADASNILASVSGTLSLLLRLMEEGIGSKAIEPDALIDTTYLVAQGVEQAKEHVDAIDKAGMRATREQEGC